MDASAISVLVIDSHPLMREALCTAIAAESGLAVAAQAAHGAEALELARKLHPEVILIALGESRSDGLETLAALRFTLPATPILALTTDELPGQPQAALACGAQVVLSKAATRDELVSALRGMRTGAEQA